MILLYKPLKSITELLFICSIVILTYLSKRKYVTYRLLATIWQMSRDRGLFND